MNTKKVKKATYDDVGMLATIVRQLTPAGKQSLSTEMIVSASEQTGYTVSAQLVSAIRREVKRQKAAYVVELSTSLAYMLRKNPSLPKVKEALVKQGIRLSDVEARELHKLLKANPALQQEEDSTRITVTLSSSVDSDILNQLMAATGLNATQSICLALRAFVQSYSLYNVNLLDLVRSAHQMGDLELAPHLKLLEQFNLRGAIR